MSHTDYFHDDTIIGTDGYDYVRLTAALAAAGIRILEVTVNPQPAKARNTSGTVDLRTAQGAVSYIVVFEFQWRSRGNYIWSRQAYTGDIFFFRTLHDIYRLVRKMRDILESPLSRGCYRYLDDEYAHTEE